MPKRNSKLANIGSNDLLLLIITRGVGNMAKAFGCVRSTIKTEIIRRGLPRSRRRRVAALSDDTLARMLHESGGRLVPLSKRLHVTTDWLGDEMERRGVPVEGHRRLGHVDDEQFEDMVRECGSIAETARRLGVGLHTIQREMKRRNMRHLSELSAPSRILKDVPDAEIVRVVEEKGGIKQALGHFGVTSSVLRREIRLRGLHDLRWVWFIERRRRAEAVPV